ncbi:MAG: PTS system mannose/fructose/sorbose family transporter subunit IID, partial [Candidatus Coatesbacteria bacterium]|nr:PTS system mannose/fructose/sorbose family transporter subunit IID [Candidatus Coatesbacteria bacterium]
ISPWMGFYVAIRTIMLEACWNNKGKQNLGFCFSLLPALKRLYSGNNLREAVQRNLSTFNTNPCFSGFIAGAVIDQEEMSQIEENAHPSGIDRLKSMLGGTFGALGDDLMWFSLKPFLGTLAVLLFLLGCEWSFVLMVALFSAANLTLRLKGVALGLKGVLAIQQFLQKLRPSRIATELKRATCVLLGAIIGIIILASPEQRATYTSGSWIWAFSILPVAAISFLLRSKNVSSGKIGAGLSVLLLVGILLS